MKNYHTELRTKEQPITELKVVLRTVLGEKKKTKQITNLLKSLL